MLFTKQSEMGGTEWVRLCQVDPTGLVVAGCVTPISLPVGPQIDRPPVRSSAGALDVDAMKSSATIHPTALKLVMPRRSLW